jgi:hypothetical protein
MKISIVKNVQIAHVVAMIVVVMTVNVRIAKKLRTNETYTKV